MRKNNINKIMNGSLGDALTIVLERNTINNKKSKVTKVNFKSKKR